jgi:hypothetical protein
MKKRNQLPRIILFLGFFSSIFFNDLQAQRFFNRTGLSVLSEYFITKPSYLPISSGGDTVQGMFNSLTMSVLSYSWEPRFNVIEFGPDGSVSLDAGINFGVSLSRLKPDDGFAMMHFTVPVMLKYNGNLGATARSEKFNGFNFGGGYQWIFSPVLYVDASTYPKGKYDESYFQPLISGGYSWFNGDEVGTININFWPGKRYKGVVRNINNFYLRILYIKTFNL